MKPTKFVWQPIPMKVLYFVNKDKSYYNIYQLLSNKFNGILNTTIDEIDNFINSIGDNRFYIKELPYQYEIYDIDCTCVFCVNKSIM